MAYAILRVEKTKNTSIAGKILAQYAIEENT
jgi:hypothetical protein